MSVNLASRVWLRVLFACTIGYTAALAILIPIIVPALDHHFAERLPGHGHVSAVSVPALHTHSYESKHDHSKGTILAVAESVSIVQTLPAGAARPDLISSVHPGHADPSESTRVMHNRSIERDASAPPDRSESPRTRPPRA